MAEKRMLILPAELVKRIDDNRGEAGQAEFIGLLLDEALGATVKVHDNGTGCATKEELHALEQDLKQLLKSFLDFFVSYGLELGKDPSKVEFGELNARLSASSRKESAGQEPERGKATIKWK